MSFTDPRVIEVSQSPPTPEILQLLALLQPLMLGLTSSTERFQIGDTLGLGEGLCLVGAQFAF